MSLTLDAVERCDNYALDPVIGFKFQYIVAPNSAMNIPGMTELSVNKWSLLHGSGVCPEVLTDDKGRVFGVFFGAGVDATGKAVNAASFKGFNCKGYSFEADLEDYLSGVAGRFVLILDSGTKTRIYRDPMGHMPLFYNAKTKLAASSVSLTIDRPVMPNASCARPNEEKLSAAAVFPMGQSIDEDVRLLQGNHVLYLSDFTSHRGWPLRNSIRRVTAAKVAPVIDKMATRLRTIVQGLIATQKAVLPLDASIGSRVLLAAAGPHADELTKVTVLQPGDAFDTRNMAAAQMLADVTGLTLQPLTRDMAFARFGRERQLRQTRKCLYWLRTSSAFRVPSQNVLGVDALYPEGHIVLTATGLDALQGGWQIGVTPKSARNTLISEMTTALGDKPNKSLRDSVEPDYQRWKSSLPKSLQPQVEDFIRIELHQPPQAVAHLGCADHLQASPFSDRELIELALKLPKSLRSSEVFAEALIAALDPRLSGLPYDPITLHSTAAQ